MLVCRAALLACLALVATNARSQSTSVVAIVGATVIDGTGAAAITDATIVIRGSRIAAVGPRAKAPVPNGARVIDGSGKFVTPGFVDTNVHVSIYSGLENFARYQDRFADVAIEAAQLHLKHGITTIRDSYGMLSALKAARDAFASGKVIGPRTYFAGNIVGWGGPWSLTFTGRPPENLSLLQEQMNDLITEGGGEELVHMEPDSLRIAINAYLDKGVDFLKYGGTSHFGGPIQIGFSDRAQKVIVEAVHARGKIAETHSTTPEGLRMSLLAGVDLVQHPEVLDIPMSDELTDMFIERKVVCAILSNTITGSPWQTYVRQKQRDDSARKVRADSATTQGWTRPRTNAERARDRGNVGMEMRRRNAEKLIKRGCIVAIATDNYLGLAPEFRRDPKPAWQDAGTGSLSAIEGLVELGMTPMQAIVAATKNGAIASHAEKEYGTIEVGKAADLVVLDADPVADIKNIRKLSVVIANGVVVDPLALPTKPVWSKR